MRKMKSLKIHLVIETGISSFFLLHLNVLFILLFNFAKTQSYEKYFFSFFDSIDKSINIEEQVSVQREIYQRRSNVKIFIEGEGQFAFKGFSSS